MAWQKQESAGIWLPTKEKEEIEGEVTAIEEGTYGKQLTLLCASGEEFKSPSHKVLQNRAAKVKVGDKVKLVYIGEEAPTVKGNNPTKMYEVFIEE